jgi:hypothetical protein
VCIHFVVDAHLMSEMRELFCTVIFDTIYFEQFVLSSAMVLRERLQDAAASGVHARVGERRKKRHSTKIHFETLKIRIYL